MHKIELRSNLTLKIHANKVYEFKAGTIGTHKSIDFVRIQFWIWFNILLQRIN